MMNKERRVVVSGMGAVTAIGRNLPEMWQAVTSGRHGFSEVERIDMTGYMTRIAGEIKGDLSASLGEAFAGIDRVMQLAVTAAKEALQDAGWDAGMPERSGCVIGTCLGGMNSWQRWVKQRSEGKQADPMLWEQMRFNGIAEGLAACFGISGPLLTISTACAAGGNAIGYAADLIRRGKADVVLAGGADALSEIAVAGFHSLQSLASEPCKPYSADRSGLTLGEGAGMLVLESEEHARRRSARIYAEILHYALSSDGYHPTAPHPEGEGAGRAIAQAVAKSGLAPEQIQYINGHGTGTPKNDSAETKSIIRALGETAAANLHVSSTKSMIGHLLGAAGAVEGIVTILALYHGIIPPTVNFTSADHECTLHYTPCQAAAYPDLTYALSNNFAFGGNNCCIAFRRYREEEADSMPLHSLHRASGGAAKPGAVELAVVKPATVEPAAAELTAVESIAEELEEAASEERIVITGLAQIGSAGASLEDFWEALQLPAGTLPVECLDVSGMAVRLHRLHGYDSARYLSRKETRRMDLFCKLTISVTMDALKHSGLAVDEMGAARIGMIVGTANGPMESLENFYLPVLQEGASGANPGIFPNTVFNQAAGQTAVYTRILGPSSTVIDGHASFAAAVCKACDHLRNGDAQAMVAIGVDTLTPLLAQGYSDSMGRVLAAQPAAADSVDAAFPYRLGEGAATVVLETLSSARARDARIYGEIRGWGMAYHPASSQDPEGEAAAAERAMREALTCGSLSTADIDAVFTACVGLAPFDRGERKALAQLFGAAAPRLASCKPIIGEAMGAAAGYQLLAGVMAFERRQMPVLTAGFRTSMQAAEPRHILINACSMTGSYTSIALSKWEEQGNVP